MLVHRADAKKVFRRMYVVESKETQLERAVAVAVTMVAMPSSTCEQTTSFAVQKKIEGSGSNLSAGTYSSENVSTRKNKNLLTRKIS